MAVVTPLPFARMLENDVGMKKLKLSLVVVHGPIGVTLGTGSKIRNPGSGNQELRDIVSLAVICTGKRIEAYD
jgi:hypothetical protein